jgi:RNA polymerase sigma factor (TIGR02999 family)
MAEERPPADREQARMTYLLARLQEGDPEAFDQLFPLVYRELHGLAKSQRRRWSGNDTLNTTGLLHEAYLKLADQQTSDWKDRSHFLAVASRAMRQILMDYAKRRNRAKRGGGYRHVSFEEIREALRAPGGLTDERLDALGALDASLDRLEAANPRYGRIVECRFFGGMTIKDTAAALDISPATVKRGWSVALAWLYRDLKRSAAFEGQSSTRFDERGSDDVG